jgi:hypothetical protein
VEVGPEHQKFYIYTALLTHYSDYFAKTLSGEWKEAQDRIIQLPDIEPRVLEIFIDWMYTQKLPSAASDWYQPSEDGHDSNLQKMQMKAYIFADRFLVPGLRCAIHNYIADELIQGGKPPSYEMVVYAFDNLPAKSKMLALVVKLYCVFSKPSDDSKAEIRRRSELPWEFLLRVMLCYGKMKDGLDLVVTDVNSCHEHLTVEERQACSRCMDAEAGAEGDDELGYEEDEGGEDVQDGGEAQQTQDEEEP